MDSRKYRSSSTTETNDAFGIGFRQFARTGHAGRAQQYGRSACEFHNLRKECRRCKPVARKFWLMPGAELSKLRAKSPAEQCHRA